MERKAKEEDRLGERSSGRELCICFAARFLATLSLYQACKKVGEYFMKDM